MKRAEKACAVGALLLAAALAYFNLYGAAWTGSQGQVGVILWSPFDETTCVGAELQPDLSVITYINDCQ